MIIPTTPGPNRDSHLLGTFNFSPPAVRIEGTPRHQLSAPGGLSGLGFWRPPSRGKPLSAATKAQRYYRPPSRRWVIPALPGWETERPAPTTRPVPANLPPMLPPSVYRAFRNTPHRGRSSRGRGWGVGALGVRSTQHVIKIDGRILWAGDDFQEARKIADSYVTRGVRNVVIENREPGERQVKAGWRKPGFRRGLSGYRFAVTARGPVGLISEPGGLAGLGLVRCGEGMIDNGSGVCVCRSGRVLAPDGSKCISPQSLLNTGAMTPAEVMAGQTPRTMSQQPLSARARRFIESQGYSVNCKITENWAATPAGGVAPRLCNVCGEQGCSGYKHAAYALNLRPQGAIPGGRVQPVRTPPASAVSASTPVRPQAHPPQPPAPAAPPPRPPAPAPVSASVGPPPRNDPQQPPSPSLTPSWAATTAPLPQGAGPQIIFAQEGGGGVSNLFSAGFQLGGYTIPYWLLAVGAYALTRR